MKKSGYIVVLALVVTLLPCSVWCKVEVKRDAYGIPSITADTESELFETFGYVMAQDRLWQMEVNRRWGLGTLAEIFGPNLVPADTQARLMGYSAEEYQGMFETGSADSKMAYQAYLSGVNRRVDEVRADPGLMPLEFLALKLKPRHFTAMDIMAFFKSLMRRFGMMGGGEFQNLAALKTLTERFGHRSGWEVFNDWCWLNDPAAPTYIREKIGLDFVPEMPDFASLPKYLKQEPWLASAANELKNLNQKAYSEALRVGAPVIMGSNTWTLSPAMTGTGYPILVGQPQMGHSVPSIIAEVELKGGRFDVVGMAFPILPIIPIGHNRFMAWSHMVGMCDNVDIYEETLNPANPEEYLFNGSWRKMKKREEKILIAGKEAHTVTIYSTIHGPVFSPFPFDPKATDVDRVYTKKLAHWRKEPLSLDGWLRAMTARNVKEFNTAMSWIMTSLHTSYADIEGNIGYWHTGLNPERAPGYDPRLPLPGTGQAEWTGKYLPNAHVVNPDKGFVTGWNNKSSPDTRNPFGEDPNYHAFGRYHRALWLERALAGKTGFDMHANKALMKNVGVAGTWKHNVHNAIGGAIKDLLPHMIQGVAKAGQEDRELLEKVLNVLAAWDGRSAADAVADSIFPAGQTILLDWLPRILQTTFGDELEGVETFDKAHNRIFGLLLRCLDSPVTTLPVSRNYFDNINTEETETAADVFLATLKATAENLRVQFGNDDPATWRAERAKIVFKHNMFGKVAEMWDNNIGTYIQIVELKPDGAVGYSRWPLGQGGHISPGADKKPVFDPHFFDMQPLYQGYTYQKMGLD